MKKLMAIILVLGMSFIMLTGCSGTSAKSDETQNTTGETADKKLEQLAEEGKTVRLGTLTMNNLSQEQLSERLNAYYKEGGKDRDFAYTYFDTLSAAMLALRAEQIDRMDMTQATAEYIAANNNDVYIKAIDWEPVDSHMAVLNKNASLIESINTAIGEMKSDGTLAALASNNIDAVLKGAAPAKVVMPVIDGAETIRVAVTGDLPPMDYTSAGGEPAGFNMGFLAELSKRINKNIELVTIDSGARIIALSTGTVDALFWARTTGEAKFHTDVPDGVTVSDTYYTDGYYGIYMKTE